MQSVQRFAIIGFMGSGKTTLLRTLSKEESLNTYNFYDLDEFIEKRHQITIKELIETEGMTKFRVHEKQALEDILKTEKSMILALGGGTMNHDTIKLFEQKSVELIWLQTSLDICLKRVRESGDIRPLNRLCDEDLKGLYEERLPFYKIAKYISYGDIDELLRFITSSTIK